MLVATNMASGSRALESRPPHPFLKKSTPRAVSIFTAYVTSLEEYQTIFSGFFRDNIGATNDVYNTFSLQVQLNKPVPFNWHSSTLWLFPPSLLCVLHCWIHGLNSIHLRSPVSTPKPPTRLQDHLLPTPPFTTLTSTHCCYGCQVGNNANYQSAQTQCIVTSNE